MGPARIFWIAVDDGHSTPVTSADRSWVRAYVAVLVVGFTALFLLTRSSVLPGDTIRYINVARAGDLAEFHYGNPSHFLQIPLSRLIWQAGGALGLSLSIEHIVVALALMGTLAAIVFVGLIAEHFTGARRAAWIGAVLFGTSLHVWTQVNGEQYGLALGFLTAGLWMALRGGIVSAGLLFGLAMISHSEFLFAGPAFVLATWRAVPQSTPAASVRRMVTMLGVAGLFTLVTIVAGLWLMGRWSTPSELVAWIRHVLAVDHAYTVASPEPFRALKGLITALTSGGHLWRDILTRRAPLSDPRFALMSAVGLGVLVTVLASLRAAWANRPLFAFALVWLLPFHVLGNWWFESTVEKYHGGALAALVVLVTGGLVALTATWRRQTATVFCASVVTASAGLNLFNVMLPLRQLGIDRDVAEQQIRRIIQQDAGAVFIACDASVALADADATFFRVRSYWIGPLPEIQKKIRAWGEAQVDAGKTLYLVGRWCHPEEWITQWSQVPFDLGFLQDTFTFEPTGVLNIPLEEGVATNPNSWRRGDINRLTRRSQLP